MILQGWLKRLRMGIGVCKISASSWNRLCNVAETIQGQGVRVIKNRTGRGWIILWDGVSTDIPFAVDTPTPPLAYPVDGEERWGRVEYDSTNHKFVQYKETYSADTRTWTENETAEDIVELESHASQHI